jgi:hypothetical protein
VSITQVLVAGVSATGYVGIALVWGAVIPVQDPDWGTVTPSQNPDWVPPESDIPVWGQLSPSQVPNWGPVDPSQDPEWGQIAA